METTWRNQLGESERRKIVQKASECIWTHEGSEAFKYLTEKRGLSETVIRQFQIGFVPLHVNHQTAGRIITPIFDAYGELVAISTRHLYKEKSQSFWHEDFDKSFYLYGLHLAKKHIIKTGKALLVEGEFDVCYLHSHDIPIAVGVCGSTFGIFQASLLARYCEEIFLLYDGDSGGKAAFKRSRDFYVDVNLDVGALGRDLVKLIPVRMPKGMDPDDFVKEFGKDGLIDLMKKSKEEFTQFGYAGDF